MITLYNKLIYISIY